jgi:uncharacterized membrane protein YgdD (TMEM256/DUF423 family)
MKPHAKFFLILGALNSAIAVALGAAGTHAFKAQLASVEQATWFALALQYHQYHALGLILTGLAATLFPQSRWFAWAGWLMLSGILLFSGALYLLSLGGIQLTRPAIPVGGFFFLAAWLSLSIGAMRTSSPEQQC